jgi:ABC-type polysaccharide/polyol phosphate export permease
MTNPGPRLRAEARRFSRLPAMSQYSVLDCHPMAIAPAESPPACPALPRYDSAERTTPFIEEGQALLQYRDLIVQLVSRSVKARYKRSFLGVAWTMVNPLLTMTVLTLVFSQLFRAPARDYALYVLSGLVMWNFFAQSTMAAMSDLLWGGGLITRVFLPKSVFALAALGTGLVNLLLALVAYAVIALVLGVPPTWSWLLLPVPVLAVGLFALGIALALSAAAVYFADVMPTYEVLLTAWLYLTPVIYPLGLLPDSIQHWLRWNPMLWFVQSFRSVLYDGRMPDAVTLGVTFGTGLAMLVLGWWIFTRKAREYAYRV